MHVSGWLAEFHRQWMAARGRRIEASVRAFRRDWEQLLDDAGIASAEDRQAAAREAEKLPQLKLHRRKGRAYLIDRIELPIDAEPWLHDLFGSQTGSGFQQQSLRIVREWSPREHPLLPELWISLCSALQEAFTAARAAGPFSWREPERLQALLRLLFEVTAREWPNGTLVRDASTALGYESKMLEKQETFLVRALEVLFGRETSLESIGIQTSNSTLDCSGPLTLHFADGTMHATETLRHPTTLAVADLIRAVAITTTAERLLTVENRKTTFLQLAGADAPRTTLIVATSFPTQAVCRLLEKLPIELPHHHFGDTDPAGWDILRKLREATPRQVRPFLMNWRPSPGSKPLTNRELQSLNALLGDSRLADCHCALQAMRAAGQRGDFEQETLGSPDLRGWPFYAIAQQV